MTPIIGILVHLLEFHKLVKLFSLFLVIFLNFCLWLDDFYWPIFEFSDPFLHLILSAVDLLYCIFLFSYCELFGTFKIYSVFLLKCSLCSCTALLSLVSIFMTIIWNSLSGKLPIYVSLRLVSKDLCWLFVCLEHIPLFFIFLDSLCWFWHIR